MDHTTLCFQISPDQLKTLTTTGRLNLDNKVLLLCEWGGTRSGPGSGPMFSGGDGDTVSCCAECGGINPSDPGRWDFIEDSWGHRSTCRWFRAGSVTADLAHAAEPCKELTRDRSR